MIDANVKRVDEWTVIFTEQDIELFAESSLDHNPLHCDNDYAHKTMYGQVVVHGILGVLACLEKYFKNKNCDINSLEIQFFKPIFCGVAYKIIIKENSVVLADGEIKLLKIKLATNTIQNNTIQNTKQYKPNYEATEKLLHKFKIPKDLEKLSIILMWSSFYVGMVCPGKQALYSSIKLDINDFDFEIPFFYSANLKNEQSALSLLTMEFALANNTGNLIANGIIKAYKRIELKQNLYTPLKETLQMFPNLQGKSVLVTGASRGFGSCLSLILGALKCHVILNFKSSINEALALSKQIEKLGGSVELWQNDVADLDFFTAKKEELLKQGKYLDILICNAAPPALALALALAPETAHRIANYVQTAFDWTCVPLSTYAQMLNEHNGHVLIVSSGYLDSIEPEYPHYLSAKAAIETLAIYAAKKHKNTKYAIIRPPKLLTDMSNSPGGNYNSADPIKIAEQTLLNFFTENWDSGYAKIFSIS